MRLDGRAPVEPAEQAPERSYMKPQRSVDGSEFPERDVVALSVEILRV